MLIIKTKRQYEKDINIFEQGLKVKLNTKRSLITKKIQGYINNLNDYVEQTKLLDIQNEYNKGYIEGIEFCVTQLQEINEFIKEKLK